LISSVIENQKSKLRDIVVTQHNGGLEDTSQSACKKFIDSAEGDELDDEKKKAKLLVDWCTKVRGLFDAIMDEDSKMMVIEDKNETYIYCDEGDKALHIVKRNGKS